MAADSVRLKRLSADEFADRIGDVLPYLQNICERGKWTLEGITDLICDARMQAWVVEADVLLGFGLTEVVTHQNGQKWVNVLAMAGEDRARWQDKFAGMRDEAKKAGYDGMRVECRPGWSRVMKDAGMRETHRVFEEKF